MKAVQSVLGPMRSVRRAAIVWLLAIGALILVTVAFWPAFKGSSGISQAIDQMPSGVVQALGLQDFASPAGFLRGNLYDFLVPLLLAGAAVGIANSLTASEEDAGRLELALAQPVTRQTTFLGRAAAGLAWLAVIVAAIAVVQVASDAVFDLSIAADRLVATIVLCGLLALFHGAVALAIAGVRARPSLVIGIGLLVAVTGCIVSALFPLSSLLAPWVHLSPWDWALGGDPLVNATEAWRFVALALPALALAAVGALAFARRDIRAA